MSFKKGQIPWNKNKKGLQIAWNKGYGVDLTCKYCSNVFNVNFARKQKAQYCSRKCSNLDKIGKPTWNKGIKTGLVPAHAWIKNDPRITGKNNYNYPGGSVCGMWNGGKRQRKSGYIELTINKKQILEHRYIMSKYLKRDLESFEEVHHINGDKTDNKIENLLLLSKSEHTKLHWREGKRIFI